MTICYMFPQGVWIRPHSPSLSNKRNLATNFGESVQICCREKEKEENNGNCKDFRITRKGNNGSAQAVLVTQAALNVAYYKR